MTDRISSNNTESAPLLVVPDPLHLTMSSRHMVKKNIFWEGRLHIVHSLLAITQMFEWLG